AGTNFRRGIFTSAAQRHFNPTPERALPASILMTQSCRRKSPYANPAHVARSSLPFFLRCHPERSEGSRQDVRAGRSLRVTNTKWKAGQLALFLVTVRLFRSSHDSLLRSE